MAIEVNLETDFVAEDELDRYAVVGVQPLRMHLERGRPHSSNLRLRAPPLLETSVRLCHN